MSRTKRAPQPHLLDLVPAEVSRVQAAAIAGVTARTIDRWLAEGVLTKRKRRGRVLVDREELRGLLDPS